MKLATWRRLKSFTQQQLADELGCIVTSIARYETGLRRPDGPTMIRIYELTEGKVEPNDFYDLPALRVDTERKAA
jgi:transcriptional regulator with XRE-family HTH domain